jgi:uncharacterized protein DUF4007
MTQNTRLPRNFHNTFIPERRYINAMMKFASTGKRGDSQTIASVTGIPTGISSGKVIPTLDYCRGMGLICLPQSSMRNAIKEPQLTSFGRIVIREDPFMKEAVTQWIAHLNLCAPISGAEIWHQLFFQGTQAMGNSFQRSQLENYLRGVYGVQNGNLIGPIVRMYEDPAAFALCGALQEKNSIIYRVPSPISDEYTWGYSAWILDAFEQFYPQASQVTVTELDRVAGWKTIPGWGIDEFQQVLRLLERKGILAVDRHMKPWILRRTGNSSNLWTRIYDDLL